MAYEALIVIGFGVALAFTSVALFWAHVQRINAPNKADPGGTTVEIDLAPALAKDEAARLRKFNARGSHRDPRYGVDVTSAVAATASSVGLKGGISAGVLCGALACAREDAVEGNTHRELPVIRFGGRGVAVILVWLFLVFASLSRYC